MLSCRTQACRESYFSESLASTKVTLGLLMFYFRVSNFLMSLTLWKRRSDARPKISKCLLDALQRSICIGDAHMGGKLLGHAWLNSRKTLSSSRLCAPAHNIESSRPMAIGLSDSEKRRAPGQAGRPAGTVLFRLARPVFLIFSATRRATRARRQRDSKFNCVAGLARFIPPCP